MFRNTLFFLIFILQPISLMAQKTVFLHSSLKDSIHLSESVKQVFLISNDTDMSETYYLYIASNDVVKLHEIGSGYNFQFSSLMISDWETDGIHSYTTIKIPKKQTKTFYLQSISHISPLVSALNNFQHIPSNKFILYKKDIFERYLFHLSEKYKKENNSTLVILGALGFVSIFSSILLIKYRSKLLAFYTIYGLSNFSLLLSKIILHNWINFQTPHSFSFISYLHIPECFQMLGTFAYLFFLVELLDLAKNYPTFTKTIKVLAILIAFYGLLDPALLLLSHSIELHEKLFIFSGLILFPYLVGILFWLNFKIKHSLINYIVFGNISLLFLLFMAYLRFGPLASVFKIPWLDVVFTMPFAVLIEMLIFAFAIATKLEQERRQKENIEKQMIEIEMMALRSQMNPHFIFNSLNSVRYFVISDQKDKAKDYLSKFAKLLRTILTYSKENTISLSNELDAIKLYLEIELGRFDSNFDYSIEVDDEVETDSIQIPPLILQPYIENAIIHGLRNSEKREKSLKISILQKNNDVVVILIEDNGIGRKKSGELNKKREVMHQSLGIEITTQRIEVHNQHYQNKLSVSTFDLLTGTLVEVSIQSQL